MLSQRRDGGAALMRQIVAGRLVALEQAGRA